MKKCLCLLLAALLCLALTGCQKEAATHAFAADNEIATYARVDPQKTQLVVSRLGNNAKIEELSAAFELQNPDVQVICLDLTGGTPGYRPVVDWIANGVAPDVMFVNADTLLDDAFIQEKLTDLSTSPAIGSLEAAALKQLAVDGHVYFLPAPSEINCILYNKTLFEQYGWSVPTSFDELLALCAQIRADTGGAVQPWNLNAKYDNVLTTALEAMAYPALLGGVENRAWYIDFCAGRATFAGHMEPFYAMIQALIDNQLLTEEYFAYSATTRGKEFEAGQLAMYNAPISRMEGGAYEFGYMPYPTTDGSPGFVNSAFSSMLCVPKAERTQAEQNALDRYLAYFCSVEGQQALIGASLMVSHVKGVPLNDTPAMAGIADTIAEGRLFTRMDFPGYGTRNWSFREDALALLRGEKTAAEIIAEIDAKPYLSAEESGANAATKLAEVTESFTVFEFSCYIADMYRQKAEADIGLINHGIAYRGNLVRLFAGDVYDTYVNPIKPRSFGNGSTLVKLAMTGRQVLEALNHPVGNGSVSNSVYAFSGLRCELAPWAELGQKYRSVALADGSALEPDKLYTVACWEGTVAPEYITEGLATYEGTWEELLTERLLADGKIAPAKDGRAKLIWE